MRGREGVLAQAEDSFSSGARWLYSPVSESAVAVSDLGGAGESPHDLAFPAHSGSAATSSTHNSVTEVLVGEPELVVKPGASTASSQMLLQLLEEKGY